MAIVAQLIDVFNFQVPGKRWQLFEICDLAYVPTFLKHCCQNTLTAQWTKRLPLLQRRAPAHLAADALLNALDGIEDIDRTPWTVIEFCSGAGGPTPTIEKLVNRARQSRGKPPIPFRLSDLTPNIDAWMEHAALSDHLSFIPQPVDASNPQFSVISSTTPGDKEAALRKGLQSNGGKVFRLFCLSFHHFDDETARRVLKSTLETSDAFAIVELQDRNIGSLAIMFLEFWLLLAVTVFWFWHDELHLLLTYAMPILPAVHAYDGFVSCLRTRTFAETMRLVDSVQKSPKRRDGPMTGEVMCTQGGWTFTNQRTLHTWPIGYMSVIFGKKTEET